MNQILITNDKKGEFSKDIKPVIKFFAIVIIIVALLLLSIGGYNLYNSLKNKNAYPKPSLSVEKNGSAVSINVKGEIGVNKLEYSWNDGNITVLKGNGKKDVSFDIEIPQGDNTLNISVIDVEGNKTNFNGTQVAFTNTDDTVKPVISIVNSDGKLVITATDEKEIVYLSYQWEGEEEVKIDASEDNKQSITQKVDVQKGTKKLTISAADKTGNKETITKNVVGSNGPEIKVTVENQNFVVKVTDEYGLTKIEYTLNNKVYTVEDLPSKAKEFEFKVPLEDGVNYLKINAYENVLMTEFKCKKTK